MNTTTKLAVYGAALALVAGGGWAIGTAVGPLDTGSAAPVPAAPGSAPAHGGGGHGGGGEAHSDTVTASKPEVGGLTSSSDGYAFTPLSTTLAPGRQTFTFRITRDGSPVTAFDEEHEKRLHLIAVRRDTAAYQHVHPEMAADGTWTTTLDVSAAGSYRVFADFTPSGGPDLTLGVDLAVPGDFRPSEHPLTRFAEVGEYRISLEGDPRPGSETDLRVSVRRNGAPVNDLEPYLGAYGHLVVLREGDLGYLHVHPAGHPGDGRTKAGPDVVFGAEVPTAGRYRVFFDFKHGGVVRTAEFTLSTDPSAANPTATSTGHGGDGHGHN